MKVRAFRQRRLWIAGDGDDLRADSLDARQEPQQLLGLAGVGDGEHDIAANDHAEVAVNGLGGMQKK